MATPPDFTAGAVLQAAQLNQIGLWVVKPKTTFTTSNSITADSVFSADYDNYLVMVTCTATTNTPNMNLQLRAAGSTASGANYSRTYLGVGTSAFVARTTNETAWIFGTFDDTLVTTTAINLWNPFAATTTVYHSMNYFGATATTPEFQIFAGNHTLTTSYDGIIMTPTAGTVTGFYTIYGYNL